MASQQRVTLVGLFTLLAFAFMLSKVDSCPQTPEQLETFLEVARIWNGKINGDVQHYLNAFQTFADNGTFEVNYVGNFQSKILAEEYGMILFVVPTIKLHTNGIYNNTVQWYAENVIWYHFNYSIMLQTNYGTYNFYNLMPTEYLTFEAGNCTNPIIARSFYIEDPVAQYVFELGSINKFNYQSVCDLIELMCFGPNQQYDNTTDCLNKFQTLFPIGNEDDAVCPYYLSSDTALCRQDHALITTTDPPTSQNHHCPHTGTNQSLTPCINSCLDTCTACSIIEDSPKGYPIRNVSSNARCVPSYTGPIRTFSCQCLDGTINSPALTTPGKMYCAPITCSQDKDCHSSKKWATCTNGTCTPLSGFSWDSSPSAYQQHKTVYCQYGASRVYKDDNGVSHCVPKGSCIYGSSKADKQCKSTTTSKNDKKTVKCTKIDGQDSLPLNRFGSCICTSPDGTRYPCAL